MKFRKGQLVSSSNRGGLWKIVEKEKHLPSSILRTCDRYSLKNLETGETISGVRDKDIIGKDSPLFADFVQLVM